MKRLLPDTQMLIWLASEPKQLPSAAADLLGTPGNALYFSLVSIWEASIKYALHRPDFSMPPGVLRRGLLDVGFSELPITHDHVIAVSTLPHLHRDPFDRLLIAQAEVEGLTLVTTDKKIAQYSPNIRRF